MKKIIKFIIVICLVINCKQAPKHEKIDIEDLPVISNNQPNSFYFRASERTFHPYEDWEARFSNISGIIC